MPEIALIPPPPKASAGLEAIFASGSPTPTPTPAASLTPSPELEAIFAPTATPSPSPGLEAIFGPTPSQAVPDAPVSETAAAETVPLLSDAQTQANIDQAQKEAEEWAQSHGQPVTTPPEENVPQRVPGLFHPESAVDMQAPVKSQDVSTPLPTGETSASMFHKAMADPAVKIPMMDISENDSERVKIEKTIGNVGRGFISGATSVEGALALLSPYIAVPQVAASVPDVYARLKRASETPAWSTERHQSAADVITTLLPLIFHAATTKGEPLNATEKGQVTGDAQQQYQGTGQERPATETSSRDSPPPSGEGIQPTAEPVQAPTAPDGESALTSQPATEGGDIGVGAAPDESGAAATPGGLPEGTMSVGGATPEEFMRRYALVGASHILDGKTDLASFQHAMEQDFGSQIRDKLPEIMDRAKQVINDFQTGTGKSAMASEINRQIGITKARETPVMVRPFVAQKAALAAAEKAGAAGYRRGLSEARAEGKAAAQQIKGDLLHSDKFMAGDQEQVRQNMIEYAKAVLPLAERGRFLNAITKAMARPKLGTDPGVMYKNAFRVMKAIEARGETVYRSGIIDDIKASLSKSLDSSNVDVAYRRQLKDIADSITASGPSARVLSKLESLKKFVEKERAAGREPNVPQDELDQLETLSKMSLKDMPTNALEQLRDRVDNLVSLGKLKAKLLERAWETEKQKSLTEMATVPSSPLETRALYRAQPTEKLTFGQRFVNAVRKTLNARVIAEHVIAPMDEIYDHLDGAHGTYDGWASRNIKGKLDLAYNETLADFLPIREKSQGIIDKFGLKKADLETIGLKQVMDNIGRERLEAMDISPKILDRIEQTKLTPGQQAYYDFARQTYDSLGPRVRDIAHRLYQKDLPLDPNYVPLQRDWAIHSEREAPAPTEDVISGDIPYNEQATMNQLQRDINPKVLSRTEQGFLKARLEGAKTAIRLNAADLLNRHAMDALHFVHSQPTLKMLGEIVKSPDFGAKFGKEGQTIVLDNLDSVATQGSVNPMQRIRWIDWVRNSTSKGAVGFRVASNFVHASQLPIAAYHAGGPQWWSKGLALTLSKEGQAFLRSNAAETFVRSGGEPAQADVEAMSGKFGRAGFFFARNLDKLNAQATFLGRYAKEMHGKGVPLDEVLSVPVDPEVQTLAMRRAHRAVASPFAKDVPQMTSRGAGVGGNVSVARALNQFRNIFLDNWSNIRHDLLRAGGTDTEEIIQSLRQGELKQGAKQVGDAVSHRAAIAGAMLMSVAMETAIKMYTKIGLQNLVSTPPPPKEGDTSQDFTAQFKHHLLNRVPFVGQIGSAIMYGDTGVPVIDAIIKPLHEIGTTLKSKKAVTKEKHLLRAGEAASTLLGVPGSSQLLDIVESMITPAAPQRSTHVRQHTKRERTERVLR